MYDKRKKWFVRREGKTYMDAVSSYYNVSLEYLTVFQCYCCVFNVYF